MNLTQKTSIATTFFLLVMCHAIAQDKWCVSNIASFTGVGNENGSQRVHGDISTSVVFHIVGNFDGYQQISDSDLNRLLYKVNEDFNAENNDLQKVDRQFDNLIGASTISFGFPVGKSEPVFVISSQHAPFGNDDILSTDKGGHDSYKPEAYLNIWIADLAEGVLGWASKPGDDISQRSIVLDYKVVLDEKDGITHRTLTHELGHFFGLNHLEGVGGCESDDGISDTPLQEYKISGCPDQSVSCGSADMVQNFMNLSSDSCLLFFTKGQVEHMETVFSEYYPELNSDIRLPVITNVEEGFMSLKATPNPFRNSIDISGADNGTITVTDINGKVFEKSILKGRSKTINAGHWPSGIYFLHVQSTNHTEFFKLIKTNDL